MDRIAYREGYNYQLAETYRVETGLAVNRMIETDFISLSPGGTLTIRYGYAWDGPSGLTIDTKDSMRSSLVHDALYQLMREGQLDPKTYREQADRLMQKIGLEDGMWETRIALWYEAVRVGAGPAADPANNKPVLRAP